MIKALKPNSMQQLTCTNRGRDCTKLVGKPNSTERVYYGTSLSPVRPSRRKKRSDPRRHLSGEYVAIQT
eukprot:1261597-Amphidinium_carterae.1